MVSVRALTLLCQGFPAAAPKSAKMYGYSSLMTYRFRQRWISLFDMPSIVLFSTYASVRGSLRILTMAMVHNALFAWRLPPRFNRWRIVLPEEAGERIHSAKCSKRSLTTQAFRIISGDNNQRCCRQWAYAKLFTKMWGKLGR